jgi:predicted Zn-dependent protease
MKMKLHRPFLLLLLLMAYVITAQEENQLIEQEESAEVFLEEYTDEFQEMFFEALKQKGIQNYDRASNLLLECKLLKPDDSAIDHELAKVNLLDKNYPVAEQYAVEALISEPENFWYLNTLNTILVQQGNTLEMRKERIPFENDKLQTNLAEIYFQNKNYQAALEVVKGLKKTEQTELLRLKIDDSLHDLENRSKKKSDVTIRKEEALEKLNPVESTKAAIDAAISKAKFKEVLTLASEAVESYPLQPYFYYALGFARNKEENHSGAIEILETGLDYIFDDTPLANRFYEELATAHRTLGNTTKANEYVAKIKSGL